MVGNEKYCPKPLKGHSRQAKKYFQEGDISFSGLFTAPTP